MPFASYQPPINMTLEIETNNSVDVADSEEYGLPS